MSVSMLQRIGRRAIGGTMPSLTLLLDVPTERGFARLHRSRDRMERKGSVFHRRVRAGYLALARREPRRFAVIDATRPMPDVRRQIASAVSRRIN